MTKLSLIIPIYKVENYIIECLESVCCQLVEGVEVILVNDGTPDNSMLIARKYISEKYEHLINQFVFIDQENQGQSIARNNGIDVAKGEYIAFLDSDDILCESYIKTILNAIKKYPDIVRFNAYQFFEKKSEYKKVIEATLKDECIITSEHCLNRVFEQCAWFPWLNVYKRKLLENDKFPQGIYFEDAWLMPKIFLKAENVLFINDYLYLYRRNLKSSLNDKSEENLRKLNESYVEIIKEYAVRMKDQALYSKIYLSFVMAYVNFLISNNKISKAIEISKLRKNIKIGKKDLRRSIKFFYYFGFLFVLLYKIMGKS